MKKFVVAAGVAALALAGCSTSGNDAGGAPSDQTSGTVRVITHDSFALPDEAIARFEQESGYTLTTTSPGDTGTVLGQLKLTKDNPNADAVFGIDTFNHDEALSAGVVDSLVGIDQGDVCVNIDKAWFSDNKVTPPASFNDLIKPEYKDLLVLTNPVTSSPGLAFLAGTVETQGDSWPTYWNSLLDNGAKVVDSWSTAYYSEFSGASDGAYPLVLSYSSSPAESEGATGVAFDTCVRQVEYAGVIAGADNPEGAQAFIDFMLEPQTQELIPEAMYMYPIDESVALPEAWSSYAQLAPNPIEPKIDREAVLKEWQDMWESR